MAKVMAFLKKKFLGHRYNSETYIKHLRSIGVRIGEGTRFYAPRNVVIDETSPCMIEIGKYVQIPAGVTILTHGFDWAVLKGVKGEVFGSRGKVKIGDNVFIGANTTILKGVTIGNNVIIAAGSLVTKDIPDNSVALGSPAKPIMTIDEYYEKRKPLQYDEAAEFVREYRKVFDKNPGENELSEFFWLFTNDTTNLPESWKYQLRQAGNYEYSLELLKANKPMFNSMQDFLDSVK